MYELYKVNQTVQKKALYSCDAIPLVSITLPTYAYIIFGVMLTLQGNLMKIICKEISCFTRLFLNLGKIVKEYITGINKLTLLLPTARISL